MTLQCEFTTREVASPTWQWASVPHGSSKPSHPLHVDHTELSKDPLPCRALGLLVGLSQMPESRNWSQIILGETWKQQINQKSKSVTNNTITGSCSLQKSVHLLHFPCHYPKHILIFFDLDPATFLVGSLLWSLPAFHPLAVAFLIREKKSKTQAHTRTHTDLIVSSACLGF